MKWTKLLLIGLITCTFSYSYEVPKDAVIKVFTKDGKQIGHMSRANYKVVKIEKQKAKPVKKQVVVVKAKKNQVIIHGGIGKHGLTTTRAGGAFEVRANEAVVGGLTYCRGTSLGICASVFTNKTFTLGVKLGF
jgi:hypothetical protein